MKQIDVYDTPKYCLICNVAGMLTCRQQNNVMLKLCKLPKYVSLIAIESRINAVKPNFDSPDLSWLADAKAELLTELAPIVIGYVNEEYELSAKQD